MMTGQTQRRVGDKMNKITFFLLLNFSTFTTIMLLNLNQTNRVILMMIMVMSTALMIFGDKKGKQRKK